MKKIVMVVLGAVGALIALCLVGAVVGRGNREEKETAARAEASKRKAEEARQRFEKAAAHLTSVEASSSDQLARACEEVAGLGDIPTDQKPRCTAAMADAKAALAVKELTKAEAALVANDMAKAKEAALAAEKLLTEADSAKPSDPAIKDLTAKVSAVMVKADPVKKAEAEQAAFAAMNSKEHLAAAKAALANGYDPTKQTGGDTHLAVRHLSAIAATTPEAAEAKKLQQEIDGRRRREKVLVCDCELVKGRLLVTEESMGGTTFSNLQEVGVDGPNTLKNNAAQWFELPEVQSVTVVEFAKYTDVRGNEKRVKVGEFTVSRARAKTINWDNVEPLNVLKVIDRAWMAPGVTTVNL